MGPAGEDEGGAAQCGGASTCLKPENCDMSHAALYSECLRHACLNRLRRSFERQWRAALRCKAGGETFNSWLFERLACRDDAATAGQPASAPEGLQRSDPLVSSGRGLVPDTLRKQLRASWPASQIYVRDSADLRAAATRTVALACGQVEAGGREALRARCQEIVTACADVADKSGRAHRSALAAVRAACRQAAAPQLESGLFSLLAWLAGACAQATSDLHSSIAAVCAQSRITGGPDAKQGEVVVVRLDEEHATLTVRAECMPACVAPTALQSGRLQYRVRRDAYERLLARLRRTDARPLHEEAALIWTMLHRYQALFGPSGEGSGWQLGTPAAAMQDLVATHGVTAECFASPLNATLPSFCSAFPDTDAPFGSMGSFFATDFRCGGSYQVGPPYNEAVLQRAAEHLLGSLAAAETSGTSLLFVCVLPAWHDDAGIAALERSEHALHSATLAKQAHAYASGFRHMCKTKHMRALYEGDTLLIWLGTSHVACELRPTAATVARQVAAWQR